MIFSNFYEETDKSNRHRWKVAGPVILLLTLFVLFLQFCNKPYTAGEIEKIISKSEQLKRIDYFCTNLPKSGEYKLLYKDIGGNSFTASISYEYQILKPSKVVFKFYDEYFTEKGWRAVKGWTNNSDLYVSKEGNQKVIITFHSAGDLRYAVYCAEVSKNSFQ